MITPKKKKKKIQKSGIKGMPEIPIFLIDGI